MTVCSLVVARSAFTAAPADARAARVPHHTEVPGPRAATSSSAATSVSRPAPPAESRHAPERPAAAAAAGSAADGTGCWRRTPARRWRAAAAAAATARTDDSVSVPVSSSRMRASGTPRASSSAAITEASDGPNRPTPPVGTNSGSAKRAPNAAAASTRRSSVVLGRPPGRTAAPKMTMTALVAGLDPAIRCGARSRRSGSPPARR